MKELKITVIIPVFNKEKHIYNSVKSVLQQDYDNLEIMIIDDGSTDKSGQICDQVALLDPRVVVYHKDNGGISETRNYGIEKALGEYITFIDADDFVDNDYISYLYNLILKYDVDMSICQHRVCSSNGKVKDYGKNGDVTLSAHDCIKRMLYHDIIDTSVWAKMYHRTVFTGIEYPEGKLFEDHAITYKTMVKSGQIAIGFESKYNYCVTYNSIVTSRFNEAKLDLLEATDSMTTDVVDIFPDLKQAALRRRVYSRFSTLNQMLNVEGWEETKKQLIEFIKEHKGAILKDKQAPNRDKIAIRVLCLNYNLYRVAWRFYLHFIKGSHEY